MKEKFEKYINKIFKGIRETQEVKDIKAELVSDLLSQSEDIKKIINDEEENYKHCIKSLGDLSELVKEYKKENNKLEKKIELPKYKLSEELINSISHGIGSILSIVAFILCIIKANSGLAIFSIFFYCISSFILYLMSCLYHALKRNNAKRIFRIIDHCSIYLLIAGTYTPVVLLTLKPILGWTIFSIVWIMAIIGIVLNAIDLKKFKVISMILYLVMGWCIIFRINVVYERLGLIGFLLLLLGGVAYTIGAILYGVGKKRKWMHSIFHIACIIGTVLQALCILLYAM